MSIKDGGPFHPCEVMWRADGSVDGAQTQNHAGIHTGASLRDHFAGLAMQGAMVNTHGLGNISKEDRTAMLDGAAAVFYEVADAMLRAREAGQ